MNNTVMNTNTYLVFHFKNNTVYTLYGKVQGNNVNSINNYWTSLDLNESLYEPNTSSPVGSIKCGSLSIDLESKNKLLIPTNSSSDYYGYMDQSVYIDVYCNSNNMGRFFVDSWEGATSVQNPYSVSIHCVDLLSKVKNVALGKVKLNRKLDVNTYLKSIVGVLNTKVPVYMRILLNDNYLNVFGNSPYNWQLYFNNIDRQDIEHIFNCIAQNTLSYIWIDRDRYLHADYLPDDYVDTPIATLTGSTNTADYNLKANQIKDINGATVEYIENIEYEDSQLAVIEDVQLTAGNNNLTNIKLNSKDVSNIYDMRVECATGSIAYAYIESFVNYKDEVDLVVRSDRSTTATITIWGTKYKLNTNKMSRYLESNNETNIMKVQNYVLRKEMISDYIDDMVELVDLNKNCVSASGYYDPALRIDDTVRFVGSRLDIEDNYKIIGLRFKFGYDYKCTATLIKSKSQVESNNQD